MYDLSIGSVQRSLPLLTHNHAKWHISDNPKP